MDQSNSTGTGTSFVCLLKSSSGLIGPHDFEADSKYVCYISAAYVKLPGMQMFSYSHLTSYSILQTGGNSIADWIICGTLHLCLGATAHIAFMNLGRPRK